MLERYRDLIPDFERFLEVVKHREPSTIRVNPLRSTVEEVRERLQRKGFVVHDVPHQPLFLRIEDGRGKEGPPVSDTLEHWAGDFYMQQTATGLAAPLLDPQPGERVLDLCAAPGGKTTHLAELMKGQGTVVASELNEGRIRALLGNIYRLGHTNIMVTSGDARFFPEGATFDRVMVDVPCSAEGTLRKRGGTLPRKSPKARKSMTRIQRRLLERAIELTRPGGTLLYVTCTFDPAENEGVLTRVLQDAPVEVDQIELDIPHERGVTSFGETEYDARMTRAIRLYPHIHDSGGLFICRLRKQGDEPVRGWTPVPDIFPEPDRYPDETLPPADESVAYLAERYGLGAEVLAPYRWLLRGTNLWAHSLAAWPHDSWEPGRWRTVATGNRAVVLRGDGPPKATNDLLQLVSDHITRRRVELDLEQWRDLLEGRPVSTDLSDGFAALALHGEIVGRAFVREGTVRHEIPKGRLKWLRNAVELEETTGPTP